MIKSCLVEVKEEMQKLSGKFNDNFNTSTSQPPSQQNGIVASREKVRSFQNIEFREATENLILGSSIKKPLTEDSSFPLDISIHSYPGQPLRKKLRLLTIGLSGN